MDELEGLGFRDFSREDSESPLRDGDIGFYANSSELSGVKIWLQALGGLGRYWPMFQIHEVDDLVVLG
uniref:Uncharacterized protein n=1 Tax=Brassica campestris TaxID=3711 RepID=M4DSS5_BRACM